MADEQEPNQPSRTISRSFAIPRDINSRIDEESSVNWNSVVIEAIERKLSELRALRELQAGSIFDPADAKTIWDEIRAIPENEREQVYVRSDLISSNQSALVPDDLPISRLPSKALVKKQRELIESIRVRNQSLPKGAEIIAEHE